MKPPLALDLCCGMGGWTNGLLAAGWHVIGVDTVRFQEYSGELRICDVREFDISTLPHIDLVTASPPCNEFSYRDLPWGYHKNIPPPDKSIWLACEKIAKKLDAPIVLENVRGAQKYMGRARNHYGPFYLWGDVPALLPYGNPRKNLFRDGSKSSTIFLNDIWSTKRAPFSARIAMIPFPLAKWIGNVFCPDSAKAKGLNGTVSAKT